MFINYFLYENAINLKKKNAIRECLELFIYPMNLFAALPNLVRLTL
jgi:hypothetical protein